MWISGVGDKSHLGYWRRRTVKALSKTESLLSTISIFQLVHPIFLTAQSEIRSYKDWRVHISLC